MKVRGALAGSKVCFGVDWQDGAVVMVRAERIRGRIQTRTVPFDSAETVAAMRRSPCAGYLTVRESLTRRLDAPFAARSKALRVLPTLLDIELPFPLEDCVSDFLEVTPTPEGRVHALAVVARKQDVQRRLEVLTASGVDAATLDQEGLAIWTQSLLERPPSEAEEGLLRAIVFLRVEQSTLVVGRGRRFLNAHAVKTGSSDQLNRLLLPYGRKDAGVMGDEPISGTGRKGVPICWFWAGPLAAQTDQVNDWRLKLTDLWPGPSVIHDGPSTFLARAVATRALTTGPLRCNLRCGDLAHPEVARRLRSLTRKAALLFLAAGLLLGALDAAALVVSMRKEAAIDRAFRSMADNLAGFPVTAKGEHALKQVGDKVRKRMESLRPFLTAGAPSLADSVEAVVDIAKRDSLRIETLVLGRDRVQINGQSKTWTGSDPLVTWLMQAGYPVRLDRKDSGASGGVPFTISDGGKP